jgi:hypothetical protein
MAGTTILISVDEAISSKTHKNDDWFDISLAGAVAANGNEILPKGLKGKGQVVHAAKSGWGGKAGELILAARYLEWNGKQIPLRGMKLGGTGEDRTGTATVVAATTAFPVAFAISGSSAIVEKGTMAVAKLAQDIPLPPPPGAAVVDTATNSTPQTQGEFK